MQEESYDLEYSRELLAEAGWTDEDGDGYVEKDGKRLTICWLTYPSRQELPLLAESAQASLKKIGIEVQIQCTANHLELLKKGTGMFMSAHLSAHRRAIPSISLQRTACRIPPRTAAVITVRHSRCWSSS